MKVAYSFVIYIQNELKEKFNIPFARMEYEHAETRKKGFFRQAVGALALKLHISYDPSYSRYIYWCIIE